MTRIFEHFFVKLISILQTIWGWVMASFLFLIDYFSGHRGELQARKVHAV